MQNILRIFSFIIILVGFSFTMIAKWIVGKYALDKNAVCNFEHDMTEEEIRQYKYDKTVVNFKMMGMLVALPGIILLLVVTR